MLAALAETVAAERSSRVLDDLYFVLQVHCLEELGKCHVGIVVNVLKG